MFGRYIFVWKEELYPVGVGAFPFMEALGLRIEAIGSVWVTVFLAALQPYKSSCPRMMMMGCKNLFQLSSLVIKTKLVQNVNRMSES